MEDEPRPINYMNYTNWHFGQPNNIGGNQDCMALLKYNNKYEWGDENCNDKHSFFCETEYATPDHTQTGLGFGGILGRKWESIQNLYICWNNYNYDKVYIHVYHCDFILK